MFKITVVVSLMLIATWSQADVRRSKREAASSRDNDSGSTLWAASLSCDSCGSECASACGTRHFRSCCFNYLRKKRGPDALKFLSHNNRDWTPEPNQKSRPILIFEDAPELRNIIPNDFNPYPIEDVFDIRQNYEQ
ncbi:uncharacterized protein LOC123666718 [Melitaea cinxia]|uniref:uncharacterized protein LOC123666718 n=1 Tax=Melitaea cinxia TaxID=113334 RepID=UPI001E2744EC|nr:uncharacterized protein LOC123666718 [Melitaea cinxia]